jgi:MFS family permease
MESAFQKQQVRHNVIVNVIDGSFFGLGMGFTSYVTVIPLFIASLTDSTILIGLIATIHTLGWQLPQLFMAGRVARVTRFHPMVLLMTLNERFPMFLLALLALLVPTIGTETALVAAFVLLLWQSIGAGLTANAWQSMLAKIMPSSIRGTFYGVQSGGANLLSSGGALAAGAALVALPYPYNFAVCFFITGTAMMISLGFLAMTREEQHVPIPREVQSVRSSFAEWIVLLRADRNFVWFVVSRALMQFGQMAIAFYTVYALRRFNMDAQTAGLLTGALLLAQMVSSPLLGTLGDRYGHRWMLAVGCAAMAGGALVALFAPTIAWFYLVFILTGVVNATQWVSTLAFTSEFGDDRTRPFYVGLSNTLIAPATIIAPLFGGVLADTLGFNATFVAAMVGAFAAAFILISIIRNPRPKRKRVEGVVMAVGD